MRPLRRFTRGFAALFSRRRQDAELEDELRQFLETSIEAKLAAGMTRPEAERAARLELGSTAAVKDWTRDVGWQSRVESVWQDVKYAVRILRRSPGFASVAVLTVALGIGTNLAIFTLADGMLFRSLPYEHADELVLIQAHDRKRAQVYNMVRRVEVEHLRAHHSGLAGIAAASSDAFWTWTGPDGPEAVQTAAGTPNLFDVIGVEPHLGRVLRSGDESIEPLPVMMAFALWSGRFGRDPGVVGKTLTFTQRTVQVVGVLPSRFMLPAQGSLGAGHLVFLKELDPKAAASPRSGVITPVARLKPGITIAAAQHEADVLVRQVALQYPEIDDERALRLADLQFGLFESSRPLLWLLVAAAGGVLLITCVNLAGLLLARGAAREREVGIRTAIGASRGRVARQFVIETLVLAVASGAVALLAAGAVADALTTYVPPRFQLRTSVVEWRTVAFTGLASLIAGALFGLGPALRLAGAAPSLALREPRRTGEGRSGFLKTGPLLVTAEVALTVTVFAATALTAHSLIRLRTSDLGFMPGDVVTHPVGLPAAQRVTPQQTFEFQRRVLDEVRRLPGVTAGAIDIPQIGPEQPMRGFSDGTPLRGVLPGYFATMGIPLIEGRDFSDREVETGSAVVIVGESFARAEWPGQSAVGRTLRRDDEPPLTVIGVVGDVRLGYGGRVEQAVYRPLSGSSYTPMTIVARGPGDPEPLAAAMRTIQQRLLPGTRVPPARTLRETLFLGIRDTQFQTMLFALFGIVGLLVAAIGIYGVMAHWVNARTRELGVRLALGAEPARLKALVVRQATVPLTIGLLVGLGGALAFTRKLQSLLYEVRPNDPMTLALALATLLAVGLLAAWIPARRAARVDPIIALRAE